MPVISMKQLLEAGVHFGHPTRKWNPKMAKYIYTQRNDIHIINLEKTVDLIDEAYKFINEVVRSGKSILFVGTKKQAQEAIEQEATRCGMFYVKARWLGGTLTNFNTIRSRIDRMNKLNQMERMGDFDILPKKEVLKLKAERDVLERNLGGIKDMRTLPGALFIVDPKKEHIAVREARKLNIPIVGIVDTNCDPDEVDYVIAANDDAIRAIKLIAAGIADAVLEAKGGEQFAPETAADESSETVVEEIVEDVIFEEVAAPAAKPKAKAEKPEAKEEPKEEVKAEAAPEAKEEVKPEAKEEVKAEAVEAAAEEVKAEESAE